MLIVKMNCFLVLSVLIVNALAAHHPDMFADKTNVMTARCRAQCLTKFHETGSNQSCFDNANCWMCWDTCNLFYNNFKVWGVMCDEKDVCFPGCQESCRFYRSTSELIEATRTDTRFTSPIASSYQSEDDTLRFEWSTPEGNDQIEPLVYVVMMKDELTHGWQQLHQTFYTNVSVHRGLLKSSSLIRLTAYDSNGKIAELETPVSEIDFTKGDDASSHEEMSLDEHHSDDESHHFQSDVAGSLDYVDYFNSWTPALNSLRYSSKNMGGVDAVISWSRVSNKGVHYEVEWRHADNTVDITGHLYTQNNHVTLTLWPNSLYQVTIRAYARGTHKAQAQSKTILVDTAVQTSGAHPLADPCPGCIRIEYLAGGAAAVASLAFLVAVILIVVKTYRRDRGTDLESAIQSTPVSDAHRAATLRQGRRSLKQQLSSIPHTVAKIAQGPLSPGKHSRLVEEDPSFTFEEKRTSVINV